MHTFDVVVIGGGAAGTAAALSAARAGAHVALVRRGPGAAALCGGGWRDAPPTPLRHALAAAGLELAACAAPLPHPDGVLVACGFAAASHARAALASAAPDAEGATATDASRADSSGNAARSAAARTIVCGIAGLPSFRAPALAALWASAAGLAEGTLSAATITLDDTPAAGWSPASLAALLDRDPARLGRLLAALVNGRRAARVILPAILGLADHVRVQAAVANAAGVAVAEALAAAPSVPGWRLDRALRQVATDAGVLLIAGRVVAGDVRDALVRSVRVEQHGGVEEVAGDCFVLASGKYIGGGITAEAEFEEPALGCDVALERFARTIDDPGAALILTDAVRTEPQPVLSAGVRVDPEGRPLTPAGDVFLANVFVAGSVRAGVETAALGLGAAATEGWAAGERAAAVASAAGRT